MATKSRPKDALAVDRAEGFLRRERHAQRVGTGILTLFVLAGAAGLFGNGPLSQVVETSGVLTVTYERFTRQSVHSELAIEAGVPPAAAAEIRVAREFLDMVDLVDVRPVGALKRLEENAAVFEVPAPGGRVWLQLRYAPQRYGVLRTDIVVGSGAPAHVRQIVFF